MAEKESDVKTIAVVSLSEDELDDVLGGNLADTVARDRSIAADPQGAFPNQVHSSGGNFALDAVIRV